MADHAKMYAYLFGEVTKIIELLQTAQQETEEMYISYGLEAISPPTENEGKQQEDDNRS